MRSQGKGRMSNSSLFLRGTGFVLLTCLLLIGMDVFRSLESHQARLSEARVDTGNLARSMAQFSREVLLEADSVTLDMRERVETDGTSAQKLHRLRDWMVARAGMLHTIQNIYLFDAAGNWLVTSGTDNPAGLNSSDRAYFRFHHDHPDRDVFVGPPIRSRADGKLVITVSRRLNDADGRFAGVILVTVAVRQFEQFFTTFDVGNEGIIILAYADGTVLARKPYAEADVGRDISSFPLFKDHLPRAPIGSFEYVSGFDGVERLGSYRRIDGYPLVVMVSRSRTELLGSWRWNAFSHLASTVLLTVLLGWTGIRLLRQGSELEKAETRYRLLAEHSGDAITCIDIDGTRRYSSPAFAALTGWSRQETDNRNILDIIHEDDVHLVRALLDNPTQTAVLSYRYRCRDGAFLWVEARFSMATVMDGGMQFILNIRDISRRKQLEEQLAAANRELSELANTDPLTGLANRRRLDEALHQEWRRAARTQAPLAVVMIDIDHFKNFNDLYGHPMGDRCLSVVAHLAAAKIGRPGDIAARYGGEEFVLLLPDTDIEGACTLAQSLRSDIERYGLWHEQGLDDKVRVTASFGVASLIPAALSASDQDMSVLLSQADEALYRAKSQGRNRVVSAGADCLAA